MPRFLLQGGNVSIHFFCRLCPSSLSERFVIGIHGIYKKAWELCFCSLHTLRFSHCPEQMNEQRRSPRCVYKSFLYALFYLYKTPMNIYRCLAVDCSEYLRDSRVSIAKRQVNASNIYAASPPAVCAASAERHSKDIKRII